MAKNLAHRGYSSLYPENTMLAFSQALAVPGCDGIELDVQMTKDGELVIIHDELVDRTAADGSTGWVKDMNLADLRKIDVSYKQHNELGFQPVPTLSEYLDFVKDKGALTNIELKTNCFEYRGIEQAVYDQLKQFDLLDQVIISSFNHYSVMRMKRLCPDLACGLLSDTWLLDAGAYVAQAGCEYYHPGFRSLTDEALVTEILDRVGINTWTVNEPEDIERLLDFGVSAVISNYPERVAKAILRRKSEGMADFPA